LEVSGTMHRLDRICFHIHGFCYTELAAHAALSDSYTSYLECETRCAAAWRARVRQMRTTEGLAIIPWPGESRGPVRDFCALAQSILGDRCFLLDANGDPEVALRSAEKAKVDQGVLAGFRSAIDEPKSDRNKEELDTAFHSLAVGAQLRAMLAERGYTIDARVLEAAAWGASFEGCVTKYSLNLRRILGLANVVEIPYHLTVPDAAFLLDAAQTECLRLSAGLRVFLFQTADQLMALYTATAYSLDDEAARVRVPLDPVEVVVRSKQGIRLWPAPEAYLLAGVPAGYEEAPLQVVSAREGGLVVPVSAGLVYRLARAPAFVLAPPGMPSADFRLRLLQAVPL
jgi:hypothetical protein